MKTIITSTFLLFVFNLCFAQASATTDDPSPMKGTKVKFDSTVVNFGSVKQGEVVTKLVTFTNTGKRELLFSACNAPSKSLLVSCPAAAIRPGQKGSVKVQFTADKLGKFKQRIDLVTNAVDGTVTITLKANVEAKADVTVDNKAAESK